MPAELIPRVVLAFAYLLVPGAGICLATRAVRSGSFATFLATSLGLGVAAVATASFSIALLGILTVPVLTAVWVILCAGAWFLAVRNGSIPEQLESWRTRTNADPWGTVVAALVIVGMAAARWTYPPIANLGATAMRYWADALEIADAGGIPAETFQWGTTLRPATSKSMLNAFNGGISFLLGGDPLPSMGILLFIVSVSLVIVLTAVFAELGLQYLAPLGAIILLANQVTGSELTADLTRNLAENWGRLLAFTAVLLAVLVLRDPAEQVPDATPRPRRRIRPPVVVAGWVLGVAVGTHLVAAAVGALVVAAYVIGTLLLRGGWISTFRRTAGIATVTLVTAVLCLVLPAGDLGFQGAVGDAEYRALREGLGLPPTFDPTRFIVTGEVETPPEDETVGLDDVAEAFAYRVAGRNAQVAVPKRVLPPWALILPTLVVVLVAAAVLAWGSRDLRVTVICASLTAGALFLVGWGFALRYDLFALERFGNRRLFNYAMLPYVMILLVGGESILRWVAGRRRAWVAPAVAAALTVAVSAVLLPSAGWHNASKIRNLRDQVELLRWVETNIPCDGRVLADRRTLGTFQVMSGHAAVVEGMGPHVRPTVLARAIGELLRARAFFEDPSAHLGFLRERGVSAIVITRPFAEFAGWTRIVRLPPDALRDVPFLHAAYRNRAGIVYLVDGVRPDPRLPTVRGRPGFRCVAEPAVAS
ncbi:MAG: hypothetical protein ACRDGK_10890 [Actinomycetota bacterium]